MSMIITIIIIPLMSEIIFNIYLQYQLGEGLLILGIIELICGEYN
jgi:hypothetical protein